ncbi:uncharacterized protein LOC114468432 isoform X2 [Gouania willdenowi]|uniref:uncharacterized protein LOC114468432 isoform X2 n=1 Tax=Gouania willdenowi TaxID=441366 RepID=UPI001056AC0A|nr:uncharacterized protein LOC114468432 isoform X2 [Gouania willdenowi]
MTWRTMTYTLLLMVFIAAIDLTKGNINEYFDLNDWKEHLTQPISLRKPKDPKNIIECTLERECETRTELQHFLFHLFEDNERKEGSKIKTEKCQGEDFKNISFYDFICLIAKAVNQTAEGCHDYETVWWLYSGQPSNLYNTEATITTTLPRTTTAPTTQLTTKSETTTLSLSSTTDYSSPTTTKETTDKGGTVRGQKTDSHAENPGLKIVVVISLIGNLVFFLLFLYGRRNTFHSTNRPLSSVGEAQSLQLLQYSTIILR